jgi:hypothetical protein
MSLLPVQRQLELLPRWLARGKGAELRWSNITLTWVEWQLQVWERVTSSIAS